MIVTKKLQQVGQSVGIILDKSVLDAMSLKKGDLIEFYFRAADIKRRTRK